MTNDALTESFARFIYYNFGGWLLAGDELKWRGLRHVPDCVADRVHAIHAEHARTGVLPEWCRVS